jgi:hypothetical protein
MGVRRLGAVAVLAVLLAACDVGQAHEASQVDDTSATLEAYIHSDAEGAGNETLTWWFEYGSTPAFGSTTPEVTSDVPNGQARLVASTVTGLDEGTTYHFRACVRGGLCGRVLTFTTTSERDSVHGLGVSTEIPELGYHVGASVDVSASPDGSDPVGRASRSPGVHYFRLPDEGVVTCLRVEGDRASIGFLADYTMFDPSLPLVPVVIYVEDVGTAGDRFTTELPAEVPTSCPDPDVALDSPGVQTVTRGDFVVHDHP